MQISIGLEKGSDNPLPKGSEDDMDRTLFRPMTVFPEWHPRQFFVCVQEAPQLAHHLLPLVESESRQVNLSPW